MSGDDTVADGFEVTPAALSGAAGVFDAEARSLDDLVDALAGRLDSIGPCWGSDPVAQRFGTAYQDAGIATIDNLRAMSIGIARIGAALQAVAHNYEVSDAPRVNQDAHVHHAATEAAPVRPRAVSTADSFDATGDAVDQHAHVEVDTGRATGVEEIDGERVVDDRPERSIGGHGDGELRHSASIHEP